MTNTDMSNAIRELSASELSDVSGGAIDLDFQIFGLRIFIRANDDYGYACVADSQTYSCSGSTSSGTPISGSGPVPQ